MPLTDPVMSRERFWSIIDRTTAFEHDQERQLQALYDVLDELPPEDIEAFERAFQREQQTTWSWDLWGAAHVIHGGTNDEDFECFQRWLISKGREVLEIAISEPDELAEIIEHGAEEPCEFEEFGLVAMDVWARKTGLDPVGDPNGNFPATGKSPAGEPSGLPVKETPAHLSRRYPKLWARFGRLPLG